MKRFDTDYEFEMEEDNCTNFWRKVKRGVIITAAAYATAAVIEKFILDKPEEKVLYISEDDLRDDHALMWSFYGDYESASISELYPEFNKWADDSTFVFRHAKLKINKCLKKNLWFAYTSEEERKFLKAYVMTDSDEWVVYIFVACKCDCFCTTIRVEPGSRDEINNTIDEMYLILDKLK